LATAKSIDNGVTWVAGGNLPASAAWQGLAFGNGIWVAVARNSNIIATSTDNGATWIQRTAPKTANWNNVTFGGGLFVIAGDGTSTIMVSSDGITWAQKNMLSNAYWYSMAYGNGAFVTLSYGGSLASLYRITLDAKQLAYVTKEYRTVTVSDPAIQVGNLLATELNINTNIAYEADAIIEAQRILDLRKVRRDFFAVTIPRQRKNQMPTLGYEINITYSRHMLGAGKNFIIIGYDLQLATDSIILYVWG
jgi:hypothetical protein